MLSGPACALDSRIARRREPAPAGLRFATVNVDKSCRLSRTSTPHTLECTEARRSERSILFEIADLKRIVSGNAMMRSSFVLIAAQSGIFRLSVNRTFRDLARVSRIHAGLWPNVRVPGVIRVWNCQMNA